MNGERQPDLFGSATEPRPTAPYQRHSPESKAAADAILPELNRLQRLVLRCIARNGPVHDEAIQEALNMNPSTERPRRVELVAYKLIEKAGTAPTRAGRSAATWRVTDEGRNVL